LSHTIFFSWQSDRSTSVCRNLIEKALRDAVRRIAADVAVEAAFRGELAVDRDTIDVPGSPPVFDTILEKIEQAIVFVPDLTFVGTRVGDRPMPNPNVLIEYGYALSQHGHLRIIAVMNCAYGQPTQENMPFNLGHLRFPIRYTLTEDATDEVRKTVRASLAKDLEKALRLLFEDTEFKAALSKIMQRPRTALDEASDFAEEVRYDEALTGLKYGQGPKQVNENVSELFAEIEQKCAEINAREQMDIEVASTLKDLAVDKYCTLTARGMSMHVLWRQPLFDSTDRAKLRVGEYRGRIALPNETPKVYFDAPEELKVTTYLPHLSRQYEVGWAKEQSRMKEAEFISTPALADAILGQFIQLLIRRSR
jgi:hypothetical protein